MAHHILVQTTLFLVVGLIERQAGSASLRRLGGLAASPLLAALFLIPALNLGGIPPFSGFIGKVALIEAGVQDGSVLAWILVAGGRRDQPADPVRGRPRVDQGVLASPRRRARGRARRRRAGGTARR